MIRSITSLYRLCMVSEHQSCGTGRARRPGRLDRRSASVCHMRISALSSLSLTGTPSSGAAGTCLCSANSVSAHCWQCSTGTTWESTWFMLRSVQSTTCASAHCDCTGVAWTLCGSRPTSLPTRARCPTQQNTAVRCTHATSAPLFDSPMTTHSSLLAFALGFGFRAVPTCSTALFLFAGPVAVNVARAYFRHNHRLTVFRAAVQAVHVDQVVSTGVRRPCATRASPHTAHSR